MVDYYPDEEGVLVDGVSVGWCIAGTVIAAMDNVKMGTATVGNIVVAHADDYEGIGIAMRAAAATGDYLPVLFYGVAKMMLGGTCVVGSPVCSGTTAGYILRIPSYTIDQELLLHGFNYTGTVEVLGKALQGGTTGDEILILVSPL